MGEPGTKEILRLEDLEAAGSIRTGRKHTLSVLVENKAGVLSRVAGLFARRGFNIATLAVGPTEDPDFSRMTITLDGAAHPIDQVTIRVACVDHSQRNATPLAAFEHRGRRSRCSPRPCRAPARAPTGRGWLSTVRDADAPGRP